MAAPYTLQYYGTGITPTDISQYVVSIDKFTDVGTGEIVSAKITLDARFGDFVTADNDGDTPIITQYDLFKLTIADDLDNTYARFLIQDDISPQKNDNGSQIILELFGRERFLQKMYFPGHFYFISFRDMVIRIRDFYNDNKGDLQPSIRAASTDLDDFPAHTYGIFEFGEETTCYDALMDVINRLSLSVAAGGAGRYFGLLFSDAPQGNQMLMRIQAQGSTPNNPHTLEKPIKITELKQPLQGNIVAVKGQEGTGSFPSGPALWRSLVEEFENLPLWDSTITYENGAYVRYDNKIYQATGNHTNPNILPTVTASWNEITFADYIVSYTGDANFQYSPWTVHKQALWRNWGGNASSGFLADAVPAGNSEYDALCVNDSNLVIRDANKWRDWADFRVAGLGDIPDSYLYAGDGTIQSRTYYGMRVLVDPEVGTIVSPFTGNDKFGNPYQNAIVQQDRDGDWIVFRNAQQYDECAVLSEGRIYEHNAPLGTGGQSGARALRNRGTSNNLAWRDSSAILLGNDTFHYPNVFENTDGLIGQNDNSPVTLDNGTNSKFTDNSAIKIQYAFGETGIVGDVVQKIVGIGGIVGAAIRLLNSDETALKSFTEDEENKLYAVEVYNAGWWCTLWESPFPKSNDGGIAESVGEIFGGNVDNKIPVLDFYNLNHTPTGKTGYGHGDSDLMGPIDGFKFLFNFEIEGIDIDAIRGDIPFRAAIYDLLGNVWVSDVSYRFQGDTQEMDFPLSSFRIYRARIQPAFTLSNAISRIITPELKITEIFERRLVKRINFHCLLSHDDQGRYDPVTWEGFLRKFITFVTDTAVRYTGTVDAFHFTKAPLAIARDTVDATNSVTKRHLMAPIKKYPKISNVAQLQKIASSELDIAKHRNDLWSISYENLAIIGAEDAVFVRDTDFVSESENIGEPGTRRLAVKKVTYSVGDGASNSGFITAVELFRLVAT